MIKLARSVFVFSLLGFAIACSSGSDPGGDSTGGSRSKETSSGTPHSKGKDTDTNTSKSECSADFGCLNGSCRCTGTKNEGKTCCDPDDSSCDGKSDNCGASFCENCTGSSTSNDGDKPSAPKDPPSGSCTDKGKECDLDSDCCSNDCDIVDGCR